MVSRSRAFAPTVAFQTLLRMKLIPFFRRCLLTTLLWFIVGSIVRAKSEGFYIGTYTGGPSKGIYYSTVDEDTGALSEPKLLAESTNPAYLTLSPDGRNLYAVNEINKFQDQATGSVSAWSVRNGGTELVFLNQLSSAGRGPCHLSESHDGRYILAANYVGGSIAVLPVEEGGRVGPAVSVVQHTGHSVVRGRQEEPHAHHIVPSPDGRFVFATDLGLDKIKVYGLDSKGGQLIAEPSRNISLKPGTGPRRILFNRARDRLYILGEIASNVSVYRYDEAGATCELLQTLPLLPTDWKGKNLSAEFRLDESGRHLYASNRGQDSLVVCDVEANGTLRIVQTIGCGGKTPRNFNLDLTGKFLIAANQDSGNLAVFRIDADHGTLSLLSSNTQAGKPVCIVFKSEP